MGYFNPKKGLSKLHSFLLILTSLALFVFVWFLLTNTFGVKEITLPKITRVISKMVDLFLTGGVTKDILISLTRVSAGFMLAVAVGVPLGILCGTYKPIRSLIETHLNFLRFIPAASMIPLLILWFGVGEMGKIALISIRALPYLVLYISNATSNIEREFIEMAKVLGANQKQILTKVIFPCISPQIWDICRIEFGSSWSTVILAEVLGANSGLGYRLVLAQRYVHITELFALIVISGLVALVIDALLRVAHRKLFPWSEKSRLLEL